MSRRLIAHVHVDGVAYGPDDEIPARVLRRIGDHAFADPDQDDAADSGDDDQGDGGSSGGDGSGDVEAPPRSGRGSGVEAWREFAEQHDIKVPAGATRDDIIEACEAAELVEREE